MLQTDLAAFHLAEADHVGLTEQDEDLHRLGHVGRLAIRTGNRLAFLCQHRHRRKRQGYKDRHHESTETMIHGIS